MHWGGREMACKGLTCITMTISCRAGAEPLIGTCLPPGSTLASYWSSIHQKLLHSPNCQSANYRFHNRRPAGRTAAFKSCASRAEATTLSHNHNYDEYGHRFTPILLFLVMCGGREMAIHSDQTAWPFLRLWKTVNPDIVSIYWC